MKALGFFRRLFGSRDLSDDDILDAYGEVLERAQMPEQISKLPAAKSRIKGIIVNRAKSASDDERSGLLVAYLALANFQDTNLIGLSDRELRQAVDSSDIVEEVLKLGPKIKTIGAVTDLVNHERKMLAEEWEQAELARILMNPTAHA